MLVAALITAVYSLRLLEPTAHPAKVKGVHTSFPVFVRLAYIWALVAGALGIWAASVQNPHGIWGASRHALTVGFLAIMVFTIGQRVTASVLRNAIAVQHEVDVYRDSISRCRMFPAR
jgi:hypothetical protein